jgi:hypothetical protein
MAVSVRIVVFCSVTVESSLKMEEACSSETLVSIYKAAWCKPEDGGSVFSEMLLYSSGLDVVTTQKDAWSVQKKIKLFFKHLLISLQLKVKSIRGILKHEEFIARMPNVANLF